MVVDGFIAKAGPLTAEQFEAYGRAAVLPGFEYFAKLFVAADGEMWGLKMAYYAATGFRRAEASRHGRGLRNPAHRPPRAL